MKKSMRLESVRAIIDDMLMKMNDVNERRCAYIHLYGVSQTATILAIKRSLNPEIAAIIGMFHDYYSYATGITELHAQNGAETVRPIIRDMGVFTKEEQKTILRAIFYHSDKQTIHSKYDELIKDADVLQHYLYNVDKKIVAREAVRLKNILNELALVTDFEINENIDEEKIETGQDKRKLLGDIAETLASKGIVGITSDDDYKEICRFWTGDNIYKELQNGWCAAFLYYCCRKAGFLLPIRHPYGTTRFAGVGAWQEWAKFKNVNYFYSINDDSFIPTRGDIVIYEKLITNKSHDHTGIVLSSDKDSIIVAEGNVDNKNESGIVKRISCDRISGYIRIDNDFKYSFNGEYEPKLD